MCKIHHTNCAKSNPSTNHSARTLPCFLKQAERYTQSLQYRKKAQLPHRTSILGTVIFVLTSIYCSGKRTSMTSHPSVPEAVEHFHIAVEQLMQKASLTFTLVADLQSNNLQMSKKEAQNVMSCKYRLPQNPFIGFVFKVICIHDWAITAALKSPVA